MPVTDLEESHHLDMICTCSDEGVSAAEELYQRVKQRLSEGSDELRARTVTDRSFWDDCLLSLNADHNAYVTGIPGDQWFLVEVTAGPPGKEVRVLVPADEPTYGLARAWEWLADRKTQEAQP